MKQRVISAIVALIIVVPLVILGDIPYYVGISILSVIAFYEMNKVYAKEKEIPVYVQLIVLATYLCLIISSIREVSFALDHRFIVLNILACMLPLIVYDRNKYDSDDALKLLSTTLLLSIAFSFMIIIRNISLYYLLYVLSITIMSDTFAHFFGTMIGKRKLSPKNSPNKTIEGFIGGVLFGTFIGSVVFLTFISPVANIFLVIVVSFILSIISELGDLVFSAIKRKYDVKDYGNIMPGHGGVVDRLDSFIFAILAFSYLVSFF